MLIDTHCHLNSNEYEDISAEINDILKSDVKKIIVSGYNVQSNKEAIELANKYDFIYASVGFHPSNIDEIKEEDYLLLESWLKLKKVVALGEIGLDYYWQSDNKEKQQAMFKRQLEIARVHNKPVIVHNRNANEDVYNILRDSNTKGVIHCFSDNLDIGLSYIKLGYLLGIGGVITFKQNNLIREVIKYLPLEYIVLETDAPYLSPEPYRGKTNKSTYITYTAHKVAEIKNISYDMVCLETTKNASRLFDL